MLEQYTKFEKLRYLTNRGWYEIERANKEHGQNTDFSVIDTETRSYISKSDNTPQAVSSALYYNAKTAVYLELSAYVDLQTLCTVESCWLYTPKEVK